MKQATRPVLRATTQALHAESTHRSSSSHAGVESPGKAVIYARAQVRAPRPDHQAEGAWAAQQVEACRSTAGQMGLEVVQEFVDLGRSARDVQQPGLASLLQRLQKNDIDYVIVCSWDRLTRSVETQRTLEQTIASCGAEILVAARYSTADQVTVLEAFVAQLHAAVAERHSYERGLAIRRGRARAKRDARGSTP
jgi:DNA invertase Pin-like site-specific DNA recombinase